MACTFSEAMLACASLYVRAKEERICKGRKGKEGPALETLVFIYSPQFNDMTALHQLTE